MSLKAKIEAVIYASEDPVTLVQLTGLLGEEAQAELDLLDAAQHRLTLEVVPSSSRRPVEEDEDPPQDVEEFHEPETIEEDALNAEVVALATEAEADSAHIGDAEASGAESNDISPAPETPEFESGSIDAEAAESTATTAKDEREKARRLRAYFREVLDKLIAEYAAPESDRGLEIREVAGGFKFATKPEYHDAVRGFVKSLKPPLKLSLQALETLAVVAYKQPVTAPEISEIRGVDSGGVLVSLLGRKLIATAGRKQVIGRPILYKTTKEFLLRFGLKDLSELPSIEEFEKLAGQMAEQEEIPMDERAHDASELAKELEPETGDAFAPAQEVPIITGDEASVDGRISSLPPSYAEDSDDPSAVDAEIQHRADGE
jgi:segregation and condensation protein B